VIYVAASAHDLVRSEMQIRKRSPQPNDQLLEAGQSLGLRSRGIVPDVGGSEQLINGCQIALVPDLFKEPVDEGLYVYCHRASVVAACAEALGDGLHTCSRVG